MYTIYDELANLGRGWERFFNPKRHYNYPLTNVYEKDDKIIVSSILPGLKSDDFEIWFEKGVLKISGDKKSDRKEESPYVRNERDFGRFVKSIRIGDDIDLEKINANYKDGILYIEMEKEEKAKPRKISIS